MQTSIEKADSEGFGPLVYLFPGQRLEDRGEENEKLAERIGVMERFEGLRFLEFGPTRSGQPGALSWSRAKPYCGSVPCICGSRR